MAVRGYSLSCTRVQLSPSPSPRATCTFGRSGTATRETIYISNREMVLVHMLISASLCRALVMPVERPIPDCGLDRQHKGSAERGLGSESRLPCPRQCSPGRGLRLDRMECYKEAVHLFKGLRSVSQKRSFPCPKNVFCPT